MAKMPFNKALLEPHNQGLVPGVVLCNPKNNSYFGLKYQLLKQTRHTNKGVYSCNPKITKTLKIDVSTMFNV